MSTLRAWLLLALACIVAPPAVAQLAPTGEHYAGRPTDTGYGGTIANATGTFSAAVPLELPPSRGGLPIPLQIAYGTLSVGAAGVGWGVPLSYLRQDSTFAYRRPSSAAETPPVPRQRTTLSLFGQRADLVRDGNSWVARSGTLELSVWQDGNTWLVYDGSGRTYSFEQPSSLSSTGLWLLTTISSPASASGASVKLTYQIQNNLPLNGGAASGISIDLTQIDYNFLPPARPFEAPGCPKNEIALSYQPPNTVTGWYMGQAAPLSVTVLGEALLVRQTTLATVDVRSRAQCSDPLVSLREYVLQYGPDADTQLPRLQSVQMFAQVGTPEAGTSLPVANYQYGSAIDKVPGGNPTLYYAKTMTISVASGIASAGGARVSGTVTDNSVKNPGAGSDVGYAMWVSLTDVTGDGRPDLTFEKDGQLWVAYNQPAADGSTTLGATPQAVVPLTDATFSKGAVSTQTSVKARYQYASTNVASSNTTDIWREAIDINGDGRMDIIDAAEEPDHWVVYLNTPGPGGRPTWVRRSFSVLTIKETLKALGHHLDGPYVPLSRRTTGSAVQEALCWQWNGSRWSLDSGHFGTPACPDQANVKSFGPEMTYVEWDLIDINGDGYPDFVFDSTPVEWYAAPPDCVQDPSLCRPNVTSWYEFPTAWVEFGPRQADGQQAQNGPQGNGKKNDILAAYNVAGVRFDLDQKVFASPVTLADPAPLMGVALWTSTADSSQQTQMAGYADINGDGLVDRVVQTSAYLGTGGTISKASIRLPGYMATVVNTHSALCKPGIHPDPTSNQVQGLRDLTGDGIPDYYNPESAGPGGAPVWIGTGTGFVGPVFISGTFVWSHQTESCEGSYSWTDGGLFDIDGDGRPDVITTSPPTNKGTDFSVYQLVDAQGQRPGRPEAGRLTQLDNGYGAVTQLSYVSAKRYVDNSLPFPENVVTGVTVTGAQHLGGSLAGSLFAYGNGALIFDTALDRWIFPGYGRSVDLQLFNSGAPGVAPPPPSQKSVAEAVITDRAGLEPFNQALSQHDRWLREKLVGQVIQVMAVHGLTTTDPWGLLSTPSPAPNAFSVADYTWEANYYETPPPPNWNAIECFEMFLPYDYQQSGVDNFGTQGIDACRSHGFAHLSTISSWRGTAAPPSDQNVQTFSRVLAVDDYGQPLQLQLNNDVFRADDDLCINNVYATPPSGTFPRVVHALASRRVGTFCNNPKSITLAYDSWKYDNLASGAVTSGRVTSHDLERHATDTGALLNTVDVFDATYDGMGNLYTLRTTRGAASRTTTYTYDPFALVLTQSRLDATGVASRVAATAYDPISLHAISTTDINGAVRGFEFDGFGRPIATTLTPAGGTLGVLSTISYLGFDGTDPAGRRVSVTEYSDPVDPAQLSTAVGQTAVTFLDELGRERQTQVSLGSDYSNQTLLEAARIYDGLGRLAFEADPYPMGEPLASAYGTTYFFTDTGDLDCLIRGSGPQPLLEASDLPTERFPTCLVHRFASHTDIFETRDAASLLPNSPQSGVVQRTVQSAIARLIERSTVSSGGERLEDETFTYDHLGQLTSLTRYLSPSNATVPTQWTRRMDSLGQPIQFDAPAAPTRFFTYSDWGELTQTRWKSGTALQQLLQTYDSLGRVTQSEERSAGAVNAKTVDRFAYDAGFSVSPLVTPTFMLGQLAKATSPGGAETFSYDAWGRANGEVFTDNAGGLYVQTATRHTDGRLATLEFALPDRNYDPEVASYSYDSANRLRSVNYADSSGTVALYNAGTLDTLGRVRSAQYATNTTYSANYANSGRELITESKVSSALGMRRIVFGQFDPLNRETSRQEFTQAFGEGIETNSTYDELGQLSTVRESNGVFTVFNWTFTYDAQGNLSRMIDGVNQGAAVLLGYSFADHDRLCRIDYGLPQPREKAPCNVVHDAVGNIVTEPTPTGPRHFGYFASGHVRTITDGSAQATFGYGPFGDVQSIDVQGTQSQQWHERRYGALIDWRSIPSANGPQPLLSRLVPGPAGVMVRRSGPGNDWIFQFGEQRGNRFFTNLGGAFVQTLAYQPYGAATSQGVTAASGDYSSSQWNGGDPLAAFGLVQLGARTYDPVIGRFLSRDPLVIGRTAHSSNPYAFAANDPVNRADPSGLDFGDCDSPDDCSSTPDIPTESEGGGSGGSKGGQSGTPLPTPPAPTIPNGPVDPVIVMFSPVALSENQFVPNGVPWDATSITGESWASIIDRLVKQESAELVQYREQRRLEAEAMRGIAMMDAHPPTLEEQVESTLNLLVYGQVAGELLGAAASEPTGAMPTGEVYGPEIEGVAGPAVDVVAGEVATGAAPLSISTPYGAALQADSAAALAARAEVEAGATLYRVGTMGKSAAGEAQFWALESPLSPGYAARYGIPAENVVNANFVETATLNPGSPFVTRVAPGIGANPGGGIEVVVEPGGVRLKSFSTGTPGGVE